MNRNPVPAAVKSGCQRCMHYTVWSGGKRKIERPGSPAATCLPIRTLCVVANWPKTGCLALPALFEQEPCTGFQNADAVLRSPRYCRLWLLLSLHTRNCSGSQDSTIRKLSSSYCLLLIMRLYAAKTHANGRTKRRYRWDALHTGISIAGWRYGNGGNITIGRSIYRAPATPPP